MYPNWTILSHMSQKFAKNIMPPRPLCWGSLFLLPPEGRKGRNRMQKSKDANSTQCSQAVSHPSTNRAQHCLTSVIGRELVYSMWYGRCREKRVKWARVDRQAALLWGEVRFCQLWNGMMLRGLSAWGVQIGSFAAG